MKTERPQNRRDFLRVSAASPLLLPLVSPSGRTLADETKPKNERPRLGLIGCGGQGSGDARWAANYGDFLAVCDVDARHARRARNDDHIGKGKAEVHEDYRKLLDRNDIDAVVIGTPDHWHSKILIDAMKAGKDAYCEKPLTLTIDEGKKIGQVAKETKRVVQVGTQQRSSHNNVFVLAVALVRSGRIGKVRRVQAAIGDGPTGGPFPVTTPPPELNWDMWLGQAPKVEYREKRCHYEFRWWYEYSGGKLTDWGAHHVDISQWGLGLDNTGPKTIEVVRGTLPVAYEKGWPTVDDRYNTTTHFQVRATFAGGEELTVRDDTENGVTFFGSNGKIFVTRDRIELEGGSVDALWKEPVPESLLKQIRKGKAPGGHMENWFECMRDRSVPASDVWSHHRVLTTCHLANIAIRLGRKTLHWDPDREMITGDDEANAFQTRPQRKGFEVTA
jgi:predicted dehydrogenase